MSSHKENYKILDKLTNYKNIKILNNLESKDGSSQKVNLSNFQGQMQDLIFLEKNDVDKITF